MTLSINPVQQQKYAKILSQEALSFLETLVNKHAQTVEELLHKRKARQAQFDAGVFPDFLPATHAIREDKSWRVKPPPAHLEDRRVEITGPVDRKMIINGLNSGAKVYMADFEDSQSPTWDGLMAGQQNIYDAVRQSITFTNPAGKEYRLKAPAELAILIVRPRGLHLPETNITLNGKAVPGAFVDFALHIFHNAKAALEHGSGPYLYLPKLESHEEARLWAKLIKQAETQLQLPASSIRVTVLIETITAVFEMHEILHELRDYCVGLNCGRWDYIFSFIKKFANHKSFVLPNREQVGMSTHFLSSYSKLLIQTCHLRGAHAMGGMAAQIPIKTDTAANDEAIAKVRADKEREAKNGHDGTWVAHPGLVPIAMDIFKQVMPQANQKSKLLSDVTITAQDLLAVPKGTVTQAGIENNIRAAVHYLAAWLSGTGCVPINHLMEDMATAEIARAQLWQWSHYGIPNKTTADTHALVDATFIESCFKNIESETQAAKAALVAAGTYYTRAFVILRKIVTQPTFADFLTLAAYAELNHH